MADWARRDDHGSHDPLHLGSPTPRSYALSCDGYSQFEPALVPDDSVFGRLPERLSPHIYSVRKSSTCWLPPGARACTPGLHGAVYETLFGLIASTGMRISRPWRYATKMSI